MKKIHVSTLLLLMALGSTAQKATVKTQELRIVPDAAEVGIPASEVLDSIEYIPLETTKESLFGAAYKLLVTKDYFIVEDRQSTKSVLLFYRNGKFYKRIKPTNGRRFGPNFIQSVGAKGGFIIEGPMDTSRNNIFEYDKDGKKIATFKIEGYPNDLFMFPNGNRALAFNQNSTHSLKLQGSAGKQVKELLPTGLPALADFDFLNRSYYFFPDADTTVFLLRNYDPNVYRVSQTGRIDPAYRFVFPANKMVPADLFINPKYKGQRMQLSLNTHFQVGFFAPLNNLLLFSTSGNFINLLAYRPATGMLWSVGDVKRDKLCYGLPLMNRNADDKFTAHEQAVYTTVSSLELMEAYNELPNKAEWETTLPPVLKTFFKKGDKDANPVITVIHFKQ